MGRRARRHHRRHQHGMPRRQGDQEGRRLETPLHPRCRRGHRPRLRPGSRAPGHPAHVQDAPGVVRWAARGRVARAATYRRRRSGHHHPRAHHRAEVPGCCQSRWDCPRCRGRPCRASRSGFGRPRHRQRRRPHARGRSPHAHSHRVRRRDDRPRRALHPLALPRYCLVPPHGPAPPRTMRGRETRHHAGLPRPHAPLPRRALRPPPDSPAHRLGWQADQRRALQAAQGSRPRRPIHHRGPPAHRGVPRRRPPLRPAGPRRDSPRRLARFPQRAGGSSPANAGRRGTPRTTDRASRACEA